MFEVRITNRLKKYIKNDSGWFNHCQLKNLEVYLNSEVYPHEDFHAGFKKNTTIVYCMRTI